MEAACPHVACAPHCAGRGPHQCARGAVATGASIVLCNPRVPHSASGRRVRPARSKSKCRSSSPCSSSQPTRSRSEVGPPPHPLHGRVPRSLASPHRPAPPASPPSAPCTQRAPLAAPRARRATPRMTWRCPPALSSCSGPTRTSRSSACASACTTGCTAGKCCASAGRSSPSAGRSCPSPKCP